MKALNTLEKKALEMLATGRPIHGLLKDVLMDMQLRDMEETQEDETQEEQKSGI